MKKPSIRTKFTIGIVFLFIIISVLSVFSAWYLYRLSKKTSEILKENHLSVIYARDMSGALMNISQEITNCYLTNRDPDSSIIDNKLNLFKYSLQLEKNNLTEPGEDKLVSGIESGFNEYREFVSGFNNSPWTVDKILYQQHGCDILYQQLLILSQINEKAIELKTDDARESAKNAWKQMAILATLCFLIALSFTYSFASYFNERFLQLFNGIKEIASSNYGQRLFFDGKDEFYEISLVFNEMAAKLNENKQRMELSLQVDIEKDKKDDDIQELKEFLVRMKSFEEKASELISRMEKMN
jgi:two-component system, NtrC family, sensor histidine kinase KinB